MGRTTVETSTLILDVERMEDFELVAVRGDRLLLWLLTVINDYYNVTPRRAETTRTEG